MKELIQTIPHETFFFSVLNEILSHLIWHRSLYANARSEFVAYHYGASEWNSLTPRKFNYPGLKAAVSCSPIFQRITQLSYQYVPKKTIKYAVGTFVTSGAHVSTQTTCAELVVIPIVPRGKHTWKERSTEGAYGTVDGVLRVGLSPRGSHFPSSPLL